MHFQWYPGHMTKARRMMQENIKLIDLIIELVDARIPLSSRNPDIDDMGKNKARLIVLNKADLAEEKRNDEWVEYFKEKGYSAVKVNSKKGGGIKSIQSVIQEACREKTERDRRRGILNRPVRAMVAGIPNVGKSTLFNSLTKAGALSANYPFATIDPNIGIVSVPDERIVKLGELYHTKKVTPATIEFVDIAGLVKGASKGEGLGNQFLANIREVDAIVHVVRCFEDTNIIHVDGSVDPARDIETINLELIFSDVEILDRRIAKIAKQARMDKTLAKELELVEAVKAHLEDGKMARTFEVPDDEDAQLWFKGYNLLTAKPTIYAANVSEDDLADDGASNPHVAKVREMAKEEGAEVFVICAQIEQELADLDEDEKKEYLEDLGVESSGLDKLVAASYSLLGLISFLTAGEDECRAWTIKKGTKAPQAAGKIHTDFERGFIKAEVVNYQDLLDNGSLAAAREKGIVGMEGKEYVVKDGDVILFRFNV